MVEETKEQDGHMTKVNQMIGQTKHMATNTLKF
jgi:hypothetical protein